MNGTGSLVLTDDLEIYNRIGWAYRARARSGSKIGRGFESDVPDSHGGRRGKNSTSEIYIRNMLDAWLGYMTGRGASGQCARPLDRHGKVGEEEVGEAAKNAQGTTAQSRGRVATASESQPHRQSRQSKATRSGERLGRRCEAIPAA